jgi:diguanylate cyclase (GGDEF)-like protein
MFEALELVDDEASAIRVLQRALVQLSAGPVEVHLAERGSTELRVVAHDVTRDPPGCPVGDAAACVALRRGRVSRFEDSERIDACPLLHDRPGGPCSAVCVPVTVSARPAGVVHLTGPVGAPPSEDVVERLVELSADLGARLGSLRALERSRQEASTDGLTGLPNRRRLEEGVADLIDRGTPFILVLADLDKFKALNDNFGHEVGDRALQLFAGVLRDNVRGNDLVARLGGEEFVLVYPGMSVEISVEAIDRLREALARAVAASSVPPFTCSFGIAHSSVAGDGDAILRVADAGLLAAKDLGGDRAVVADAELAARIFDGDAPPRTGRDERP